jgi:spore maturation protein SpmB
LVLNTSGLTLIPTTIMLARAQLGAVNPTDIFIPVLIATFCSTFIGLITVALWQRIKLTDTVLLAWLLGAVTIIGGIVWYFSTLDSAQIEIRSKVISAVIIFSLIVSFITGALVRKVNVYETFIEGAKGGFETAVKIIPYLVAMLVGIAVFRASGAMDVLINGIGWIFQTIGFDTSFVPAIPTALMKPLSGSGAKATMLETMKTLGADSFAGRLSCIYQGAADTTFYIVALYFGSVGVRKTRYAITCGLIADLAGIIGGTLVAYLFFGR